VIADAALAAGAPASIASPRIEVTSPTLAERDRTSETLDTTDTGHLLNVFPSGSRARVIAGPDGAESDARRLLNQPSFGEETSI